MKNAIDQTTMSSTTTTALAPITDADGVVYLPHFGSRLWTERDALLNAQGIADQNGAPCGVWARDGWYTICDIPPEMITPDPTDAGWVLHAVVDPMADADEDD